MREIVGRHEFGKVQIIVWNFLEQELSNTTGRKYRFQHDPLHWRGSPVSTRAASYLFTKPGSSKDGKKSTKAEHRPDPNPILEKLKKLRADLRKAGVFQGTEYYLRIAENELLEEVAFYEDHVRIKGSMNWLAIFVAEQCAIHYLRATENTSLAAGTTEKGDPSGPFGRLVKSAFAQPGLELHANWLTYAKHMVEDFDYEKEQCTGFIYK